MRPGDLVAAGRTSDVYRYGNGAVVKVPRPQVPDRWVQLEAEYTAAISSTPVPSPAVLDVTEVDGRTAIVFEHIDGPSMWELMRSSNRSIEHLVLELAECQRTIFATGPPAGVDGLLDRLLVKLDAVEQIGAEERREARTTALDLPHGAALLHGDLHPGNVLMTDDGPVAIDWFDAAIGHPVADVVRTSLLIRPHADRDDPPHLPNAEISVLRTVHDAYLDAMSAELASVSPSQLRQWEALRAVGRLAEGTQPDGPMLMEVWRARHDPERRPLSTITT